MLEGVAIDRSLGCRENVCELRYRGGGAGADGGWLMRVGGNLVEGLGRGMS